MIALYATASSSSSSGYFLRHVELGSPFTPSLPYMLPMEIYTYLSYRPKINETDVSYTRSPSWVIPTICRKYGINSCDSLNGSGCSLLIFIRFTIPMISEDFLTRWNAITVGKGRGKGQFLGISHFWLEVLGLLPYEGTTFIPNLSS